MKYNKSLHPDDYGALEDYTPQVNHVKGSVNPTWHHKHRLWEYAQALRAVTEFCEPGDKILEIGAGGSAMPCVLAQAGYDVTVVDPDDEIHKQRGFADKLEVDLTLVKENYLTFDDRRTFDAVICLSTIEHVAEDKEFLLKASQAAKKLLVVSTDFHPDGTQQTPDHLRAYNEERLQKLADILDGWQLADKPEWIDNGGHVNGYNFASMVLVPASKASKPKPDKKDTAKKKTTSNDEKDLNE